MCVKNKTIIGLKYYWDNKDCSEWEVKNKTIIGLKFVTLAFIEA